MNSREISQNEIEDIINSQKERYNEQLKTLYEVRIMSPIDCSLLRSTNS